MNLHPRIRRIAAALTATALASTFTAAGFVLAAAPAQAAPAFSELNFSHSANTNKNNLCNAAPAAASFPDQQTVVPNVPLSAQVSTSRSGVSQVDPANDALEASASTKLTAKATTSGGLPRSLRLDYASEVKAKLNSVFPVSDCAMNPYTDSAFRFKLVLAQPLWVTLSYAKKGVAYAEAYIYNNSDPDHPYEDLYGQQVKGAGRTTVLLPPGDYSGYLEARVFKTVDHTQSHIASGTVQIDFATVGSATAKPAGKAQGYAALAGARSCSVHALPAKLSTSSKRIKAVKKITFAVNGKTVKTLRGTAITRGAAVKLPIADTASAAVKTTVRLKNGKTYTAKAAYRPCA